MADVTFSSFRLNGKERSRKYCKTNISSMQFPHIKSPLFIYNTNCYNTVINREITESEYVLFSSITGKLILVMNESVQ